MSAYPMPNGFPMNMSQQQQQQQQQQMMQQQMQANSNPLQPSANFSTPEQRMWQLQRLQMENQRRAQMGVGDGMGSQMNPQVRSELTDVFGFLSHKIWELDGSVRPLMLLQHIYFPIVAFLGGICYIRTTFSHFFLSLCVAHCPCFAHPLFCSPLLHPRILCFLICRLCIITFPNNIIY